MLDAMNQGGDLAVEPNVREPQGVVVTDPSAAQVDQNVTAMLEMMSRPPAPAQETVTLLRSELEGILRDLEDAQAGVSTNSPSHNIRKLRDLLALPQEQLWAVHSVGPQEWYPVFSKEDGERRAQEIRDACAHAKECMAVRGESVEHYPEIVVNVIPSPWPPAEHFEILAELWNQEADDLRETLLQERQARDPESEGIEV